ncbi:MAG: HEAT repeat domain-containing protein, partial [Verrucomicrobiota bacterium]|nr:HEAT repeat domain-containing protein [Verrucomicrobiota bacterium]
MKKRFIVSGLLALALGVSVRAAGVEDLLKEFRGLSTEQERSASELQSALTQVMEHLAPGLGSEDFQVREQAQSALQDVALRAGRPGADAEQSVLTDLLVAYSAADQPSLTRVWCIRMLEQMGGVAAVDALDGYLDDESDEIGDCARRALQRMPAAKAADVLRKRLNSAQTAEQKIGFMTALAWRGDREATGEIQRFLKDSNEQVVLAAINSLAKLPDARAVRTLIDMRAGAEGDIKVALTEALL